MKHSKVPSHGGVVACLVLAPCLVGCATVAETGRKQLMLISPGQETALGAMTYKRVLKKEKAVRETPMNAVLERVGKRIAAASGRTDLEWEFNLFESKTVNAFCLPGGKVAVYTGILPVMKNEAGLAIVLGHEVAHATARHGAERLSQALTLQAITSILSSGLDFAAPTLSGAVMQAFGVGTHLGVTLPYSRSHESEADYIGLLYAARAGYDPREAVPLWERMEVAGKKKKMRVPEFISTHPREKRRIEKFEQLMPAALEAYGLAAEKLGAGDELPAVAAAAAQGPATSGK